MMKKSIMLFMVFLPALLWAGAKEDAPLEHSLIKTAALNGPTGIGLISMMNEAPGWAQEENLQFDVIIDPKLLVPALLKGEYQAAVVPANMGALLTAKGAPYRIAAVVGYGVIYMVGTGDPMKDISGLTDKTLYLSGKGATPDYLTQYFLDKADLVPGENIQLDFSYTHPDLTKALISGLVDYALLPEPFTTTALMANENLSVLLDYQEQWTDLNGSNYPISVLLVSDELTEQEDLLLAYLNSYSDSIDWVNKHAAEAAALAPGLGFTLKEAVLKEAIGRCNLQYTGLEESRAQLDQFYSVLYEINPASIGGSLPGDDAFLPVR